MPPSRSPVVPASAEAPIHYGASWRQAAAVVSAVNDRRARLREFGNPAHRLQSCAALAPCGRAPSAFCSNWRVQVSLTLSLICAWWCAPSAPSAARKTRTTSTSDSRAGPVGPGRAPRDRQGVRRIRPTRAAQSAWCLGESPAARRPACPSGRTVGPDLGTGRPPHWGDGVLHPAPELGSLGRLRAKAPEQVACPSGADGQNERRTLRNRARPTPKAHTGLVAIDPPAEGALQQGAGGPLDAPRRNLVVAQGVPMRGIAYWKCCEGLRTAFFASLASLRWDGLGGIAGWHAPRDRRRTCGTSARLIAATATEVWDAGAPYARAKLRCVDNCWQTTLRGEVTRRAA